MNEDTNLQISTNADISYEPMLAAAFSHRELIKKNQNGKRKNCHKR